MLRQCDAAFGFENEQEASAVALVLKHGEVHEIAWRSTSRCPRSVGPC